MSRRQAEISQSVYISKIHLTHATPLVNMPPLNEPYIERFVRSRQTFISRQFNLVEIFYTVSEKTD